MFFLDNLLSNLKQGRSFFLKQKSSKTLRTILKYHFMTDDRVRFNKLDRQSNTNLFSSSFGSKNNEIYLTLFALLFGSKKSLFKTCNLNKISYKHHRCFCLIENYRFSGYQDANRQTNKQKKLNTL